MRKRLQLPKASYMEEKKKHRLKEINNLLFKASFDVKGIQFRGQFILKFFTIRRSSQLELLHLLDIHPPRQNSREHRSNGLPFPSTMIYLPTNFTILAKHAWHTLTLGLGTEKSKALLFVLETETMKSTVGRIWPTMFPLGDVNKRLICGLTGCEMARFKFRKGCLTFYIYAVRRVGASCFHCAGDLRVILDSVVELKDFIDHTSMLALPRSRRRRRNLYGSTSQFDSSTAVMRLPLRLPASESLNLLTFYLTPLNPYPHQI